MGSREGEAMNDEETRPDELDPGAGSGDTLPFIWYWPNYWWFMQ